MFGVPPWLWTSPFVVIRSWFDESERLSGSISWTNGEAVKLLKSMADCIGCLKHVGCLFAMWCKVTRCNMSDFCTTAWWGCPVIMALRPYSFQELGLHDIIVLRALRWSVPWASSSDGKGRMKLSPGLRNPLKDFTHTHTHLVFRGVDARSLKHLNHFTACSVASDGKMFPCTS